MPYSPSARQHLLDILENPARSRELQLQLAITVDIGKAFVSKTYLLEGDGEVIVEAFDHLQELSHAVADPAYSNTKAIARHLAGKDAEANRLIRQVKECVTAAVAYFRRRMNHQDGEIYPIVLAFKAIHMLCPKKAMELHVSRDQVETLRRVPQLDDDEKIRKLQDELPAYLAAAEDTVISPDNTRLQWWQYQKNIPAWQDAARIVFSMLPSSAPAERVFSLLEGSLKQCTG